MGTIEVTHVSDFLSAMFHKIHAYSNINRAKCATKTIVHIPPYDSLIKRPLISKYMTGKYMTGIYPGILSSKGIIVCYQK